MTDPESAQTAAHDRDRAQLERLTFFSDAVFAIAMTLLVIEVRLPHLERVTEGALGDALLRLIPNYVGFVISFVVVGRFWVGHHRILGLLRAADDRLVWVNLLFLMAVAFMPFPTAVMSEYSNSRVAVCFYTAWLTAIGLVNRLLAGAALGSRRLVDARTTDAQRAFFLRTSWTAALIGALALGLGLVAPLGALAGLTVGAPVLGWLLRRGVSRD